MKYKFKGLHQKQKKEHANRGQNFVKSEPTTAVTCTVCCGFSSVTGLVFVIPVGTSFFIGPGWATRTRVSKARKTETPEREKKGNILGPVARPSPTKV